MPPDYVARYCSMMKEIKARMSLVAVLANTANEDMPRPMRVETAFLNMRKVLELIAMGSLLTNARAYAKIDAKMHERWNAKRLLAAISAINSDFYPKPIQIESVAPFERDGVSGRKVTVEIRTDRVLTRIRFVEFYEHCGRVLHTPNPFAEALSFVKMEKLIPEWYTLTTNLLNTHIISMAGTKDQLLVQMGKADEEPGVTFIGPAMI